MLKLHYKLYRNNGIYSCVYLLQLENAVKGKKVKLSILISTFKSKVKVDMFHLIMIIGLYYLQSNK